MGTIQLNRLLALAVALMSAAALAACATVQAPAAEPQGTDVDGGGAVDARIGAELDADYIVAAHEEVVNRVYELVLPSVVHIRVARSAPSGDVIPEMDLPPGFELEPDIPRDFFGRGYGSGFVWSDEGYIVTNHHVVYGADRVSVIFADGAELEAEIVGSDPDSDLAVIRIDVEPDRLTAVTVGDNEETKVGQVAIAIGSPFGQSFTVTTGIISALGRTIPSHNSQFSIPSIIQTDASINRGSSGGPLLDRHGRVIGVNTQIISTDGVGVGVGFAVPANIAKRVVPALISEGHYEHAFLGIRGVTLRPDLAELNDLPGDTRGILVVEAMRGGPANTYGVMGSTRTAPLDGREVPVGGDVIVAIDDTPVQGMEDLIEYLVGNTRPGDTVTLDLLRGQNETVRVDVTLASRPQT